MTELERLDYEFVLQCKKQRNNQTRNGNIFLAVIFIGTILAFMLGSRPPQPSCHMGDSQPCIAGPVGGGGGGGW